MNATCTETPAREGAPVTAASTKEAAEAAASVLAESGPYAKLVIAIHGIGDQYRNATIQSVVTRFGHYFKFPTAVPLGSFNAAEGGLRVFSFPPPPSVPDDLRGIGFVEAYWADIPRGIAKEGYILEESKAWARTVVERVRARYSDWKDSPSDELHLEDKDFRDAAYVLQEMVETIHLLGNLLFLAEKVGLPKFELDELLTNYLGDVQVVADFESYRFKILRQFRDVIDPVWKKLGEQKKPPDLYFVAHSEGTVIAFMGLLQA